MKMKVFEITHNTSETSINGFDIRIVPYEEIHNIRLEDFKKLVKIIDPQDNDIILDGGAGYGAVSREILSEISINKKLNLYLLDISPVQLQRATVELNRYFDNHIENVKINFVHDSIVHPRCQDSFFDKVACKMVIHEISKGNQQLAINEIHRILKNEGKFVIWDLMLNEEIQPFFQSVIRKKDELAGYKYLAKQRYFLREDEWIEMLVASGFKKINKEADISYELHSLNRLKHEFNDDMRKLDEWHDFIRYEAKKITNKTKEQIGYSDNGNDIVFNPPKFIYSAQK